MRLLGKLQNLGTTGPIQNPGLLGRIGNMATQLNNDPNWQALQARQRGEDPYQGQLMQMRQQEMERQQAEEARKKQAIEAFMQSPEFQQLDPLSKQIFEATGDTSVLQNALKQRQGMQGQQALSAFGQNPASLGKSPAEQYSNLLAAGVDPATAKNAVTMANPNAGQGGGIGQYNPRDYTTDSWSKFIQSNNPGDLVRYETPDDMPNYIGQEALASAQRADKSFMDSRRYANLADQLVAASPQLDSGSKGAAIEFLKSVTGDEDINSLIRKQYQEMRVSSAINNLPPGVASDKDIALVMSSTLDTYANPETIAAYLRGLAKAQKVEGEYNQFVADYLYKNGSAQGLNQSWRDYAERNAEQWGLVPNNAAPPGIDIEKARQALEAKRKGR